MVHQTPTFYIHACCEGRADKTIQSQKKKCEYWLDGVGASLVRPFIPSDIVPEVVLVYQTPPFTQLVISSAARPSKGHNAPQTTSPS